MLGMQLREKILGSIPGPTKMQKLTSSVSQATQWHCTPGSVCHFWTRSVPGPAPQSKVKASRRGLGLPASLGSVSQHRKFTIHVWPSKHTFLKTPQPHMESGLQIT